MILDRLPLDLGEFPIHWDESCFYLYLPIKMAGIYGTRMPERLKPFYPLIRRVENRILTYIKYSPEMIWKSTPYNSDKRVLDEYNKLYIYLTVKHMLVNPGFWGNRGGAHADGFGTKDLNWIWYDKNPTEFNSGPFDVSEHEHISLTQFEEQWKHENTRTYPVKHLLKLNSKCVHRVARVTRYDMRTFVKISASPHKYNLVGNSHNYLFDYEWEMHDRQALRNQTHNNNSDYVLGDIA